MSLRDRYDVIVVGGGSAGCVLANRLSEDGRTVLLVEAGSDTTPTATPPDILDLYPRSYYNKDYMWRGLRARLGSAERPGTPVPFTQAKVMGGGSSLMGMIAVRGLPDDYDAWDAAGASGWSYADVVDDFARIEADWDYGDRDDHGEDGRVVIRRHRPGDWPPFTTAIAAAAVARGLPLIEDMNTDFRDGVCALPMSAYLSRRSSSTEYLSADVRARPNLDVVSNTFVERLLFTGTRCDGIEARTERRHRRRIHAGEVVLAAGAIHSPALLQRSGIGPAGVLAAAGVPVVADSPGVGENLQNHPVVYLATHVKHGARQSSMLRPQFLSGIRYSSGEPETGAADMMMLVVNKSSWHGLGQSIAGLGVSVYQPFSRGQVRITDADPETMPDVRFGLLSDKRDRDRMLDGLRFAVDLMKDQGVRAVRNELFATGYTAVVRKLNEPGRVNTFATSFLARLLDGPDPLRRAIIRWGVAHGDVDESRMGGDAWLETTLARHTFGMYHAAGTCKMGGPDDPLAVVDPDCRVYGVEGLRVVDASIMPQLVRANTNIPVMMLAEHASARILRGSSIGIRS